MPHRPSHLRRSVMLLPFIALATPLAAHDLWLEPSEKADPAGRIEIRAVVGAKFPKGEEAKAATDYREIRIQQGQGVGPLVPPAGDPKLLGRVEGGAAFFVAALGPTREIDLKPEEVRGYLSEEAGLDAATLDAVLKGAGATLHETYSRFLKALVIPKGAATVPADTPMGLPLELVLSRWDRQADGTIAFGIGLQREGRPVPGASLRMLTSRPGHQTLKTDGRGEAAGTLKATGPVLFAFIELAGHEPGRYSTRWTNLAVFDRR